MFKASNVIHGDHRGIYLLIYKYYVFLFFGEGLNCNLLCINMFFDPRMEPKDPLETMPESGSLLTRKDQRELRRGKGRGRGRGRGRGKKEPVEDMLPPPEGEGGSVGAKGEGEHTRPPSPAPAPPPPAAPHPAPKRKAAAKAKAKAKAKASPSCGSALPKAKAKATAKAKSQSRKRVADVAGEGGDHPEVEGVKPRPKRKPRQIKCDVPDPIPVENRDEFKKFHV